MSDDRKKKELEALVGLSPEDLKRLKELKIKLDLFDYYTELRTDIISLNEQIKMYELMILRNYQRIGIEKEIQSSVYDVGEPIPASSALHDPDSVRDKIDEYRKKVDELKNVVDGLVGERDSLADKVDELVRVDGLTGLYNKREFERKVKREIARSKRSGECFVIAMADVDHFKEYNDTYGHFPAGDFALKNVAQTISDSLREEDIAERGIGNYEDQCGRYGGEEFSFMVLNTPKEKSQVVPERVRRNVEAMNLDHFEPGEKNRYEAMTGKDSRHATISIGYFFFDPNEFQGMKTYEIYEIIIKRADKALYAAKHAGRNCIKEYSPEITQGTKN